MEEDRAPPKSRIDYEALDGTIAAQRIAGLESEAMFDKAIDALLTLEKQMRVAEDVTGTRKVLVAIVQLCFEAKAWKKLNDNIMLLSKRRGWLKQAIGDMVQEVMKFLDYAPNQETEIELIKTLNLVCAGKIFVEIERARLIRRLAKIKEDQGLIAEAAELIQEVAVETFGAMAKTEKIAFILEQIRLCLKKEDYMRAQILSRKINPKVFLPESKEKKKPKEGDGIVQEAPADVPSLVQLKRMYYELMIRFYSHSNDYLEICRCYQAIYETVQNEPSEWIPFLRKICWNLVLSPHDSMQSSLMHQTLENKKLSDLPQFRALLTKFVTMEVIIWDQFWQQYQGEFEQEAHLPGGNLGPKAAEDLRCRVIEHNILVVSKYYSRITLKRLSELLCLTLQETETRLSEMVVSKALIAKVDRPAGIVSFVVNKDGNDVLNTWAVNIEKLLELVEKSCHKIHKETMVHKVTLKA